MKALIITQYFYPETFRVNTFAKELVNRGYDVTVLTGYPQYPQGEIYDGYGFNKPYEKEWNGVKIERLKVLPRGKTPIGLLLNCLTFVTEGYKWVKQCNEKYDFIYVFEVSPVTVGLPAVKYKDKFGTPIFFNVQDLWPENVIEVLGINNKLVIGIINKIVDKIYANSDKILCASKGFVENIAARGVPREKLVYWPQFCEVPNMDKLQKPECYDVEFFNIVFTGNIGYAQGLDLLVETADKLREKPIRWYLVGDGRAKESLKQKVMDKQLSNQIIFIGKVSEEEANAYVRFADCAYLSFTDCKLFDLTIPAKLQTYLACGTPILGAVGGESAEIIRAAKCGVVSHRDAREIACQICEILDYTEKELELLRENASLYFNKNFHIKHAIDSFEQVVF